MLGNSLEEIAYEKAGIIKPHVPVLIGERQPGLHSIFEKQAATEQSAIYFASDEYKAVAQRWQDDYLEVDVLMKEEEKVVTWKTDLQGIYQTKNICTVLKAEELITVQGFSSSEYALVEGL